MTEEIRPICLYVETCLDRKEGTRDCAKCEHHLNYWTEVMIRDMEKNITRLEQENKALKDNNNHLQAIIDDGRAENKRFREENKELKEKLDKEEYNACCECTNIQNQNDKYRSALEEIREMVSRHCPGRPRDVLDIINEVLQCE